METIDIAGRKSRRRSPVETVRRIAAGFQTGRNEISESEGGQRTQRGISVDRTQQLYSVVTNVAHFKGSFAGYLPLYSQRPFFRIGLNEVRIDGRNRAEPRILTCAGRNAAQEL